MEVVRLTIKSLTLTLTLIEGGEIDNQELMEVMRSLGLKPTVQEIDDLANSVDEGA